MKISVCPVSVAAFAATAYLVTSNLLRQKKKKDEKTTESDATSTGLPSCQVVFILGGPGSGKGTMCTLLVERLLDDYGRPQWAHLSAGDLLREERNKGGDSELSKIINENIRKGALVPSEVVCRLLEQGMQRVHSQNPSITKFLIDGFPRSHGNATVWKETMSDKHKVNFVLNLACPEEVLTGRLLQRGKDASPDQRREDDANVAVIRKRFQTFTKETAPVLEWYESQNLLQTIASDQPIEDVYRNVSLLFLLDK